MLSDTEFRSLLEHLSRPWAGYRKVRKGVKKRVRRHMRDLAWFIFIYLASTSVRPDVVRHFRQVDLLFAGLVTF